MPLLRYFLFVGGSLLGLLLAANVALPTMPLPDTLHSGSELPPVRIHSERKLPERVVFDTSAAQSIPAPAVPVVIARAEPQVQSKAPVPAAAAAMSAKARVREAFAQLPPGDNASAPKMNQMATVVLPEPKMYPRPQAKKAAAKPRPARPPMMVAQQPRFGGFDTW